MTTISAEQTPHKVGGAFNRIGSNIRTKLMLILLTLTLVPIILSSVVGYVSQRRALQVRTFDGIEAIRILKGQSVATYMKSVKSPAINFSASPPAINAAQSIKTLITELNKPEFTAQADAQRAKLDDYYRFVFAPEFELQNPGTTAPLDMLPKLDQAAVLMQSNLLLGDTTALSGVDTGIKTQYNQVFTAINNFAVGVQKTWSFSNMFIIDPDTGVILYSVTNRVDIATSLIDGPYAESALGDIFQQSLTLTSPRDVIYSDFASHIPTYLHPEFYVASPIFAGTEKIGILILATPVDTLSGFLQPRDGLGETGQTYLVGSDYLWRSDSPFLADIGVSSTILNESVRTETPNVKAALQGKSGTGLATNTFGERVLMSWQPLVIQEASGDIERVNWAVITEINQAEVNRAANLLLLQSLAGLALLLIAVALISRWFSRQITQQIGEIHTTFDAFENEQFDARAKITTNDELGQMAGRINNTFDTMSGLIQTSNERDLLQTSIFSLLTEIADLAEGDLTVEATVDEGMTGAIADSINYLAESLRTAFNRVGTATLDLTSSVSSIQMTAEQLATGAELQASQIVDTSAAIDEMAISIQQVSQNSALSAKVGEQAQANAQRGGKAVRATIEGMSRIRTQVQNTSKSIKRLGEGTQEIDEMLQLIRTITKRTSILALNASIQASRAGEAGRGFMVVAEEVEQLAERSADATKQIELLIQTIQTETNEAVASMEATTHEVVVGSQLANEAGNHLTEIEAVSKQLSELIQGISLASKQQARGSESIALSMNEIAKVTQQTAGSQTSTSQSIINLTDLSEELREAVSAFKITAASEVSDSEYA